MKNFIFLLFLFLILNSFLVFPNLALADVCTCRDGVHNCACGNDCSVRCCGGATNYVSCEPSDTSGGSGGGTVSLDNPLPGGKNPNINLIIGQAINGVLGLVGSLALIMVVYGGFTWMLAAGNQTRVQKGKDILIWAVVGLAVIFSAYALVRFLFVNIFGATPAATSLLQLFRLV